MRNTFLVIFLNRKVGSILNLIRKVSLSIFEFKFYSIIKHSIRILTHRIFFNIKYIIPYVKHIHN
jgi:hypothetical protein